MHTLPPLPPALLVHSAFAMPRSPLLHRLYRLLAACASALHTYGETGRASLVEAMAAGAHSASTEFWNVSGGGLASIGQQPTDGAKGAAGEDSGDVARVRVLVYQTVGLAMRLLCLLVDREGAVRSKLKRLRASQQRIASWRCWSRQHRALLQQLYAELWRTLPPLATPSSLALSLAHPILYSLPPTALPAATNGTARRFVAGVANPIGAYNVSLDARAARRSPLGSMIHVMHAASSAVPAVAGKVITWTGLRLLRRARTSKPAFTIGGTVWTPTRTKHCSSAMSWSRCLQVPRIGCNC